MNLYVSNLSYTLTDDELRAAFEAFGAVTSARVILDRETGRSRGFGFVEMPDNDQATAALNGLNSQEIGGRQAKVVEARPKEERPGGFGGGGPRPYGGGGAPGPRNFGGGGGRGNGGGGGRDWGDDRGGGGGRGKGGRDKGSWDRGKRGGGGFDQDDGGGW
jgi:RNA recognition motif-containing protein